MYVDKDTLRNYQLLYFQNELPVPLQLKNGKIDIYPIMVRDWSIFEGSLGVLQIDKNKTNNIEQIQMSYMDFLFHLIEQDEQYKNMLVTVLRFTVDSAMIQSGQTMAITPCSVIPETTVLSAEPITM